MLGLDIIGAGENLSSYTILFRIRSVDTAKLQAGIAGNATWGSVLPAAVMLVDTSPGAALDIAIPILKSQLAQIGITADVAKTEKGPKAAPQHEMLQTLVLGGVTGFLLGVLLALFGKGVYHLITPAR
jgi:hypothetical protein